MNLEPSPGRLPAEADQNEQRLAQVLAELAEQLRAGRCPDLEESARQHPDLAAELRSLWPAVMMAEEAARPAPEPATLPSPADPEGPGETAGAVPPRSFGDYD